MKTDDRVDKNKSENGLSFGKQHLDEIMEDRESEDGLSFLDTDTRWRVELEARQATLESTTKQSPKETVVIDEKTEYSIQGKNNVVIGRINI